jgi:hypothetical protein
MGLPEHRVLDDPLEFGVRREPAWHERTTVPHARSVASIATLLRMK